MLYHDIFTNGIGYVDLVFKAGGIPVELIPYLGLLKAALGQVDTEHYTYGEFSNELNLHTGGILSLIHICPSGLRRAGVGLGRVHPGADRQYAEEVTGRKKADLSVYFP